jgi:hypothetical protein
VRSSQHLLKTLQKSSRLDNTDTKVQVGEYKADTRNDQYRLPKKNPKNSNYFYLQNLLEKILTPTDKLTCKNRKKPVESYRLYNFSKQFINTYTVAFMIIYFFTVFLLRMSNVFGNKLVTSINLIYQYLIQSFSTDMSMLKILENHNLFTEFAITCLMTSGIIFIQLILSIKNFKRYVFYLRKCKTEKTPKFYVNLWESERERANMMITAESLHFPGYLIAHLVYSYWLIFAILFVVVIILKFLYYFPSVLNMSTQLFLPLIIIILLKILSVKFLTRTVFLNPKDNKRRMTNLTPYYTMVYFNFFFDCFLGFVECLNRIWQTTVVSLFFLPRLDISMFNEQNKMLLHQLDKGHLAYICFVHMEW